MMGRRDRDQGKLFYEFNLDDRVPKDHLLRRMDVFVTVALSDLHAQLEPFYSGIGRPSVDPELMIRMLLVGYCYGLRSERRLCQEVALHLAYRWFCRLDIEDRIPHHSTFSLNRLGRFRESDILRHIFERVVVACIAAGLVKGEGFAVDASVIEANASRFLGWLVKEKRITPHIPVWDKSRRDDGTFSRDDFTFDKKHNRYVCPAGKALTTTGRVNKEDGIRYVASLMDCRGCPLKPQCYPNMKSRQITRDIDEDARDVARRKMKTKAFLKSRDERKRVEMRFGHLKTHHGFERMRLRGLTGARDEFHLAAIVQNLKTMALRLIRPPPEPAPA